MTLKNGSGVLSKSTAILLRENSQFATLDAVLQKHKFDANFIKVDTDGFDFKVLRSGIDFIKSHKPSLYFEWDKAFLEAQGEDYLSIFDALKSCGYKRAIIFDNFGSPMCALALDDTQNLTLLARYVAHSNCNIYYYDVLILGENLDENEFLEYFYAESRNSIA
ncbi:FkbM family methyltransferase [Helicobacter sp. 23-1045]